MNNQKNFNTHWERQSTDTNAEILKNVKIIQKKALVKCANNLRWIPLKQMEKQSLSKEIEDNEKMQKFYN